MTLRWLLHMARWARQPPSARQVRFVLAIVAVALLIAGYEHLFGWPESLTPNSRSGRVLRP